jgi:hypothetical protein
MRTYRHPLRFYSIHFLQIIRESYNALWLDINKLQITNHTPFVSLLFVILVLVIFLHFASYLRLFNTFLASESKYYL